MLQFTPHLTSLTAQKHFLHVAILYIALLYGEYSTAGPFDPPTQNTVSITYTMITTLLRYRFQQMVSFHFVNHFHLIFL